VTQSEFCTHEPPTETGGAGVAGGTGVAGAGARAGGVGVGGAGVGGGVGPDGTIFTSAQFLNSSPHPQRSHPPPGQEFHNPQLALEYPFAASSEPKQA